MIKETPNVSVILPIYNGERFIESALNNLIKQNYPALEVVLIDDGSTDNTEALASRFAKQDHSFSFCYHQQPHSGVATARNLGLELASHDLIAFLDVDDLWPKNKLKSHLNRFEQNPKLSAVLGQTQFVEIDHINQQETLGVNCPQMLLGAGLYKRCLFDQIGRFNTSLQHGEDWDWFLRCREASAAIKVFSADAGLIYRRHANNLSLKKERNHSDLMRLLKQSLDRRRETPNNESHQNDQAQAINDQVQAMDAWSTIIDSSE